MRGLCVTRTKFHLYMANRLNNESRYFYIWREKDKRYHPSNIVEKDAYDGKGVMVWAGIMTNGRTPLHVFDNGTLNAQRYRDEILKPHVQLFREAVDPDFMFMDDNTHPHRAGLVNELMESEDTYRMECPTRSSIS
ncbi:hypothetical protein LAZ67_22001270 [Cordylochernes scorpioides]|uniref:Transposase n=1 Tax=Cordylochernes scorpioides TaxID=51811 RepID=A0ABY6LRW4_9ARAC|nr:hypothetical protein LAZ67_22001270 [Cordylochernes scorpioides]